MSFTLNIEERLYPVEYKSYLLEAPWLRGMKYFPEHLNQNDNFNSYEAPILLGGKKDEDGDYVIPEIFIGSEDYEFLIEVSNYFMERNGDILNFEINTNPTNGLSFLAESELFLIKIEFFEQHQQFLLTIGYYGNYGRFDKLFEGVESVEFGICSKSEYFADIVPGIGCVYGNSERSTGGQFFLAQEKDDSYHISAFSEDFNHLFLKHLRAVTNLKRDVFDFNLAEVYPNISKLAEKLSDNPFSSFYYMNNKYDANLSLGNNLWRLDIEIYKTEKQIETIENDFVASYVNHVVWMLILSKDYKRAQALLPECLKMSENKNSLDTAAVLYFELKEHQTALEYANKAIALDETIADHFLTRAKIYLAMENFELAKLDLLKTLKINPFSDIAKELLASIE